MNAYHCLTFDVRDPLAVQFLPVCSLFFLIFYLFFFVGRISVQFFLEDWKMSKMMVLCTREMQKVTGERVFAKILELI